MIDSGLQYEFCEVGEEGDDAFNVFHNFKI